MARFSTAAKALRGPFKKLVTKLGLVLRKPKDLLRNLRAAAATRAAARRRYGGFTRAELIAGAEAPDRNGLTQAGRALQKHGGRDGSVFWSMSSGSAKSRNAQGLTVVDEILSDPLGSTEVRTRVMNIRDATGRGVRYSKDGAFMGLLEPGD